METPSSTTRRVTRSQALAAMNSNNSANNVQVSKKIDESEKSVSKSRQRKQQDRSALFDISNDSPIVGLAKGSVKTPSSAIVKQMTSRGKGTPGSGEALLRGQVKTLLLKVEEDAEISKLTPDTRQFVHLQGFVNSPMGLLAPTPANTPYILDLSGSSNVGVVTIAPPVVEQHLIAQLVNKESDEDQKSQITRSLLLDFSEKSEISDSSEVTEQGAESKDLTLASPDDEDDASVWSIQVNGSSHDEDEVIEEEEEDEYYEGEEEEEGDVDGEVVDALCEGINHMSMNEKFEGKHTRFEYNSDDELVVGGEGGGVLRLKGLPTPKGKHLRFQEDEE